MEFIDIVSGAILMKANSYSKQKMAIESLSCEEWFRELYKDSSYAKVIWYNKEIKKLLVSTNIEMMKRDEVKVNQFIQLVKRSANDQ